MVRIDPFVRGGPLARTARPPEPALPLARLQRLGATDRMIEVAGFWWDGFEPDDQGDVAAALSEMTDAEMTEWLRLADVPGSGTIAEVMDWVEAAEDRRQAAYMAMLAETRSAKPRKSLIESLSGLSTG